MKILMIIKTSAIDYDERLKKEIDSLINIGVTNLSLFAVEDIASHYSNPYVELYNPKFLFRNLRFRPLKIFTLLELIIRLKLRFKTKIYDKVWIHDPIMMFLIPVLKLNIKPNSLIWDLHELPSKIILDNFFLRWLFKSTASICSTIIVANKERGEYLTEKGLIKTYKALYNYPVQNTQERNNYNDIEFDNWIKDKEFAYCQSATHPSRNFFALAKACVNKKQFLVVAGEKNNIYQDTRKQIPRFDEYILVLGKKPSDKLYYYYSNARFSFVFYSNKNTNNYLCAPNRLYSSIKFGIPVIVGANPTMKNIVEVFKCGVSLNDFGDNSHNIENAIEKMNRNHLFFKKNTKKISEAFDWNSQENIIKEIATN